MEKPADTSHPVHPLIARRWSPRAFARESVSDEELAAVLEAARWAPSSFNDQPWTFVVARREELEAFERLASLLVPGNRRWAEHAPVLLCSVTRLAFDRNGEPNRHAYHDVGLASAMLALQAEELGLALHMMAGFDVERARELLGVPEGHDPVAMAALGRPGDPESLPEGLRERELAPRSRKPLAEVAHGGRFGAPLRLSTG